MSINQRLIALQNRPAGVGTVGIDSDVEGGMPYGVLFLNPSGNLAQNDYFSFVNDGLRLIDKDYVPFEGALDADCLFSVGSNDNVQNNAGTIETDNHFVGAAVDLKIVASGEDKWLFGQVTQLRISGDLEGSAPIYGHWLQVCNRGLTHATPTVYGAHYSVNLEGNADEAIGLVAEAYRGSAVTNPKFTGLRGIAGNGYIDADEANGVEGRVKTVSSAAKITTARSIWANAELTAGHTVTNLRGVSIDNWTMDAAVTKSTGLYIDTSVDHGSESYAIESLSESPSLFSGAIQLKEKGEPISVPANSLYLYAEDSGGKTKLMVKFPSGSAVQLAIEP